MQLFISYKRENESFARLVREKLQAWGYAVWMDIFDIPKGSYWPDEIDKGLRASDVIVGILSPQAVESRNVKNEWDWAIVNGRRLILLMHEQTYVPMNYVSLNYINCVGSAQSHGINQLQTALQSKPSAPAAPPDPFRDYLQKLYDRINRYLGQKILATLRTDEGMPEPLRLTGASTPEAVEGLFSRQPQIDPLFAIGGIDDDPTPLDKFTDFQQAFDHFRGRVLLLGEPGAGKTITLLHTARDAVVRRLQDPTHPLPILGIIPTWDADKRAPIADWLIASDPVLRNPLPMLGEGQGVGSIIQQGRALLLLDGLDELGSERPVDPQKPDGEKFDPRQRFLDALPANNQILVTCRRQDYTEIGSKAKLNGAITLQPLSESQIAAYLRGTEALWKAVQNDDGLREMAKTPLLLSFFAFAYHDHPEDAERLTNLADSPGDLRDAIFERYVRERYEHEERKLKLRGEKMPYSLAETHSLLCNLAKRDLLEDMDDDVVEALWLDYELADNPFVCDEAFIEHSQKLNYLISIKSDNATYAWVHRLLRDYFASRAAFMDFQNPSCEFDQAMSILVFGSLRETRAYGLLMEKFEKEEMLDYVLVAFQLLREPRSFQPLMDYLWRTVEQKHIIAAQMPEELRQFSELARKQIGAIEAIIAIGSNSHMAELIDLHKKFPTQVRSEHIVFAAGEYRTKNEEALQIVFNELMSNDFQRRSIAIEAAGKIGDPRFVSYLVKLLNDRIPIFEEYELFMSNCQRAKASLRAIGTPEALAAIEGVECPEGD